MEIYLNGEQVYNRKEPPNDVVKDPIGDVRGSVSVAEMVRTKLLAALNAATAEAEASGSSSSGH